MSQKQKKNETTLRFVLRPDEEAIRIGLASNGFPTNYISYECEALWNKSKSFNWKVTVQFADDVNLNPTIKADDSIGTRDVGRFKGIKTKKRVTNDSQLPTNVQQSPSGKGRS